MASHSANQMLGENKLFPTFRRGEKYSHNYDFSGYSLANFPYEWISHNYTRVGRTEILKKKNHPETGGVSKCRHMTRRQINFIHN